MTSLNFKIGTKCSKVLEISFHVLVNLKMIGQNVQVPVVRLSSGSNDQQRTTINPETAGSSVSEYLGDPPTPTSFPGSLC